MVQTTRTQQIRLSLKLLPSIQKAVIHLNKRQQTGIRLLQILQQPLQISTALLSRASLVAAVWGMSTRVLTPTSIAKLPLRSCIRVVRKMKFQRSVSFGRVRLLHQLITHQSSRSTRLANTTNFHTLLCTLLTGLIFLNIEPNRVA